MQKSKIGNGLDVRVIALRHSKSWSLNLDCNESAGTKIDGFLEGLEATHKAYGFV